MANMQKFFSQNHAFLYRISGGRLGGRFKDAPVLILTTTGSKTGQKRSTPLLYVEDGEALVIVASNGGSDKAPSWFSNLLADPAATVQVGAEHRNVRAHVASPAERERLWPKALAAYRTYEEYQSKTERQIPVVILEPAS
jgi:deazaflavin-dependent oxidoreductase (nitroreductase family)